MRLKFWEKRRCVEQPKDIRSALSELAKFLEECDRKTEGLRREIADRGKFQVTVVRRELNLPKPINLLVGLLILALGFGIGHWSKSQDYNRGYLDQLVPNESGGMMLITPGAMEKAETAVVPALSAPVVSPTAVKDRASEHSSQDTLLQKVRDLLERVKRGE